jgi:ATP-dependent Zn protease
MKFLKYIKLVAGCALIVTGLTLLGIWYFRTPSREITRAELDQFVQAKTLTDGRVRPTPYAGIYHLEGKHKLSGKSERVFVTTHLDEAQTKALFDQSWAKVEIPDQGSRGQWVMILSNLLIVGVVIGVMMYQRNIGRGKNARVTERPTVSFNDVAGIEEAKGEVSEVVDGRPAGHRKNDAGQGDCL